MDTGKELQSTKYPDVTWKGSTPGGDALRDPSSCELGLDWKNTSAGPSTAQSLGCLALRAALLILITFLLGINYI